MLKALLERWWPRNSTVGCPEEHLVRLRRRLYLYLEPQDNDPQMFPMASSRLAKRRSPNYVDEDQGDDRPLYVIRFA
jgi:hypothetical protein